MIARWCVWWVNSFLVFALVVVPVYSALAADHYKIGYHGQKRYAENSAKNAARQHCSEMDLVIDQQGPTVFGTINNSSGLWCSSFYSTCKSARVNYNCVVPPPRSTTRQIFNVEGNWHCENPNFTPPDLVAYRSFENALSARCEAINPTKDWFLDDAQPTGRETRATGQQCQDNDDNSLSRNRLVRYRGNGICKLWY